MNFYTPNSFNGENNMDHENKFYAPAFAIPHCQVMLVLDTSHSMWGQGLADLQNSLQAFFRTISQENFPNAEIDIAAVSMGENLGMLEEFTPFAASTLPLVKIRPKGDRCITDLYRIRQHKLSKEPACQHLLGVFLIKQTHRRYCK